MSSAKGRGKRIRCPAPNLVTQAGVLLQSNSVVSAWVFQVVGKPYTIAPDWHISPRVL